MIKLNRMQLVVCWISLVLISSFILAPVISVNEFYKYESKDGWSWKCRSRAGELKNESGIPYRISKGDSDGTEGKKYYYVGSYNEYSLNKGRRHSPTYAYGRIILVIILNSLLLLYTLGRIKPLKTSDNAK